MSQNPQFNALMSAFDPAQAWWRQAPGSARMLAGGAGALLLIMLIAGSIMAASPEYADLFTGLDPHDTAAIAQKLDDSHVRYQITDNETAIRVPIQDKDRTRLDIIRAGLPQKAAGLGGTDWLDKIGMGTTSDVQSQYIKRAKEGELAGTISTIVGVQSAVVQLSEGNDSPFADQTIAPKASVLVTTKPGSVLANDEVLGIANLVAKAVPGLTLKNIAIVDGTGRQLWDGGDGTVSTAGNSASTRLNAEGQFAETMRNEMQAYLDTALGPHKALVSVRTELNYNQVHQIKTVYGKGAILSTQINQERYRGQGAGGGSRAVAAGIAGNTPGATTYPFAGNASNHASDYLDGGSTTNYSNDKSETEVQQAPGALQKLMVAVLIDSSVPQDTVASLTTAISTLAGALKNDPNRIVTVQSVPFFAGAGMSPAAGSSHAIILDTRATRIAAVIVVAAALLLLLAWLISKRSAAGRALENNDRDIVPHGERSPIRLEDVLPEVQVAVPPRKSLRSPFPAIEEQLDLKLESVRDMVREHPQSVALLMKGWMADEMEV